MGYDMYIVQEDAAENAAERAGHRLLNAACDARNKFERGTEKYQGAQDVIDALVGENYKLPTKYFRLNIWGMSRCLDAMHGLGMLDERDQPAHEWPDAEAFGVTDEMWDDEGTDGEAKEMKAYREAREKVTDFAFDEPRGLPYWKFGSNDGWRPVPEEIRTALEAYESSLEAGKQAPDFTWWGDWIDYLKRAQARGGFRVC